MYLYLTTEFSLVLLSNSIIHIHTNLCIYVLVTQDLLQTLKIYASRIWHHIVCY